MVFSKENLLAGLRTCFALEIFIALGLFIMGCSLASSYHYRMALGAQVGSSGGGLIFLSLLYPLPAWFALYASKYHNKFMLLVHFLAISGLVVLQIIIGGATYAVSIPTFTYDVIDQCLVNRNLLNATILDACQAYFQSDEFAGLTLSWQTYYNESLNSDSIASSIQSLQNTKLCCGLGPPGHCITDSRPFPSQLPSSEATMRQFCANKKGYYPPTPLCYKGGSCAFDHPIGSCGVSGVAEGSTGCARHFHEYMSKPISSVATVVLFSVFFPVVFGILSMCLLFKRKDEDVLPTISYASRSRARVYIAADLRKIERQL